MHSSTEFNDLSSNREPQSEQGTPIVSLSHVSYTYSTHTQAELMVLRDISLDIYPGEFVLVLGPSGCGKSTLIQLLNGTIPHSLGGMLEGEVSSCGLDVHTNKVATFSTKVGMVFQDPDAQIINTRVRDEVCFCLENLLRPAREILQLEQVALEQVGLLEREYASVFDLSGGQKQRVSLAAVLAAQPQLLVLDEPTANLDPQGMREVFETLEKLNRDRGVTIVIVEHRVDELASKVTRVVVMEEGTIAFDGSPREAFSRRLEHTSTTEATLSGSTWIPQVSELAIALRDDYGMNVPVNQFPLVVEEALTLLETCIQSPSKTEFAHSELLSTAAAFHSVSTTPLIEIQHLNFAHEDGTPVLHDVSLHIPSGGIIALLGRNGSGKTTLAKTLLRINSPPKGKVFFLGTDICRLPITELTRQIGYVFQNPDHQFVTDRVEDEVAYSLRVRRVPEETVTHKVDQLLKIVDLERYRDESPFCLSLGERRRLSVATMLVLEQQLLILDEPTIGQDHERAQQLMQMMHQLGKEFQTTVLMITHDMRLVAEWANRAIVISNGKIHFDGSPLNLFARKDVLEAAALLPPPLYTLTHQLHSSYPKLLSEPTISISTLLNELKPHLGMVS